MQISKTHRRAPSGISKKNSFSLKGARGDTSKGSANTEGRTRKGKATETHAQSRASSGTEFRSGKGILPGSEYQKAVSSSSRRRTRSPFLSSKIKATSFISSRTNTLPRTTTRHPHRMPAQRTDALSSSNFRKINAASPRDISLSTIPPWVNAFTEWFSEQIHPVPPKFKLGQYRFLRQFDSTSARE